MEKNKSIWVLESYTCNRKPELYVDLDIIVLNEINKEDSLDYVIKKLNENLPEKVRKLKRNRIKESHQFLLDKIGSGAYLMLLCNDCGMENKCYRTLENSEEYNLYLFFFNVEKFFRKSEKSFGKKNEKHLVVAKDEKFAFDLINKEMEARKYDFERENESCREIKLLPGETLKLTDELEAHYWLRGSI